MRQRRSETEWHRLVSEFKRSGQTQRAFAERHGIPAKSFGYWVRGRRRRGKTGATEVHNSLRLVPVQVRPSPLPEAPVPEGMPQGDGIEVLVGPTVRVRFPAQIDATRLARFVGALREVAPC